MAKKFCFLQIPCKNGKGTDRFSGQSLVYAKHLCGTFKGEANEDGIAFTRPDGPQQLSAGNGEATGLKWLADKKDCLIVDTGEGYCRD